MSMISWLTIQKNDAKCIYEVVHSNLAIITLKLLARIIEQLFYKLPIHSCPISLPFH